MSATLGGLVEVSSAMTNRPAFFAWLSALLTASPLVVIKMPLSPREMALSMAEICAWVSPSVVPAATVRLTLSFAAADLASLAIDTKYGLLSVFRINETPTFLPVDPPDAAADAAPLVAAPPLAAAALVAPPAAEVAPPDPAAPAEEPLLEPQAVAVRSTARAGTRRAACRVRRDLWNVVS